MTASAASRLTLSFRPERWEPVVAGAEDPEPRGDRLGKPLRWRSPRLVEVCPDVDPFAGAVPEGFLFSLFEVMLATPQHRYLLTAERADRMEHILNRWCDDTGHFGPRLAASGVWLGVRLERARDGWRIPHLLRTTRPGGRFLRCAPLLGDLGDLPLHSVAWVLAAGQRGAQAGPTHPDWLRGLRDQCAAAQVPFSFLGWGEWAPGVGTYRGGAYTTCPSPRVARRGILLDRGGVERSTSELNTFSVPADWARMTRLGRLQSGRQLDGQVWDELPEGLRGPVGVAGVAGVARSGLGG